MSNLLASLSLLTAGLALSAFDLPVQLPSGQIFYLSTEHLRIDQDSHTVHMDLTIKDPDERRLFFENSYNISELIYYSLKDGWEFPDNNPNFLSRNGRIYSFHNLFGCLSGYISSDNMGGKGVLLTPSMPVENLSPHSNFSVPLGRNYKLRQTTLLIAIEGTNPISNLSRFEKTKENQISPNLDILVDNNQDKEKKDPVFHLSFSTFDSDFGGGWRLTPCKLRFIKKQGCCLDNRSISDGTKMMPFLAGSAQNDLYQKHFAYFAPLSLIKNESTILYFYQDSGLTPRSLLQGSFYFDPLGQLVNFFRSDNSFSIYYNYLDGKLVGIQTIYSDLFFKHEGKKVPAIHRLSSSMIHLEYDDQDHLCRVYDDQDSFLLISYDEDGDLYRITDDSDAILFKRSENINPIKAAETIPLLFNGFGEVFYYKDSQNNLKISFRSWEDEDDE